MDGDVVPGHGLLGFYLDHIHGEAGVSAGCPVIGRLARALRGLNLRHLEPGGGGSGRHRGGGCLRWGGWAAGGRGLRVHVPDADRRLRVEGLKGLVSFLEAVHCVGVERVNSVKTAQRCASSLYTVMFHNSVHTPMLQFGLNGDVLQFSPYADVPVRSKRRCSTIQSIRRCSNSV